MFCSRWSSALYFWPWQMPKFKQRHKLTQIQISLQIMLHLTIIQILCSRPLVTLKAVGIWHISVSTVCEHCIHLWKLSKMRLLNTSRILTLESAARSVHMIGLHHAQIGYPTYSTSRWRNFFIDHIISLHLVPEQPMACSLPCNQILLFLYL